MPSPRKPVGAKVKRGDFNHKKAVDQVAAFDGVCGKGATCAAVTGSTSGSAALAALTTATTNAKSVLVSHTALLLAYRTSCRTVADTLAALGKAGATYMNAVDDLAAGDATIIADAGLAARESVTPVTRPSVPTNVHFELGKVTQTAILGWDEMPGAGAYRLRVNFTPADPTKWQELPSGTSRRRLVTAPTAAAQFLASVASIGSETPSDWSDPVLVTAR